MSGKLLGIRQTLIERRWPRYLLLAVVASGIFALVLVRDLLVHWLSALCGPLVLAGLLVSPWAWPRRSPWSAFTVAFAGTWVADVALAAVWGCLVDVVWGGVVFVSPHGGVMIPGVQLLPYVHLYVGAAGGLVAAIASAAIVYVRRGPRGAAEPCGQPLAAGTSAR